MFATENQNDRVTETRDSSIMTDFERKEVGDDMASSSRCLLLQANNISFVYSEERSRTEVVLDQSERQMAVLALDSSFLEIPSTPLRSTCDDFNILCVIGVGAYGKVFLVQHIKSSRVYAMKRLRKSDMGKSTAEYIRRERNIMTQVTHPFIVKLHYAFQSYSSLYLVMEYCAGGELFFHLRKHCMLLEDSVRFYAAELVLALEHLHSLNIIHRYILLNKRGYIMSTLFKKKIFIPFLVETLYDLG